MCVYLSIIIGSITLTTTNFILLKILFKLPLSNLSHNYK